MYREDFDFFFEVAALIRSEPAPFDIVIIEELESIEVWKPAKDLWIDVR